MSRMLVVFTVTSFMTCASLHAAEPRVGFAGYGAARIGMTRSELQDALGKRLVDESPGDESNRCTYVYPEGVARDVGYMLLEGRLARVDVDIDTVSTISGARIGSTEAQVRALYPGRVQTTPHHYEGPVGHYLVVLSPDGRLGVRFETDGERVTRWYAGTQRAIQYVEGCQ